MPVIADYALLITAIAAIITAFIPIALAQFNYKIKKEEGEYDITSKHDVISLLFEDVDSLKKDLYDTIGRAEQTHEYLQKDLDELKRILNDG